MKIKSYKKLSNNRYKITFEKENEAVLLYDEIILKYNLLLKKEISKKGLEELKEENEKFSCYYKAIEYLARRNRSKKEIYEYLKKQKFEVSDILGAITLLEEKKIINEESYLQSFLHNQMLLTYNGPKKIERKLIEVGLKEDKVKEELFKISKEVWQERLKHLVEKKVKADKKDGIHKLKEKILYQCINEGYEKEEILGLLNQMELPKNKKSLEKEATKILKKLSLKYNGNPLIFQVKGRLLNKGFELEDIDSVLEDIKKSSS